MSGRSPVPQWAGWRPIRPRRTRYANGTCRRCEKISQPPAPIHATPWGWAGPNLLAMVLFEKYGAYQPLNRQRDRYAREGVDLSQWTLADQVGACTVALRPLHDLIAEHVLAADRLHGDDAPVPVLAKGKTATGRAWVYVRDDRPFGGPDPPAALFRYSRDRSGDHPVEHLKTFSGIVQAYIYAGFNRLYEVGRSPGPIVGGACWAHCRRKFYELADIAASKRRGKNAPPISPLALEAVMGADRYAEVGPMTVLGPGESVIEEGNRLVTVRTNRARPDARRRSTRRNAQRSAVLANRTPGTPVSSTARPKGYTDSGRVGQESAEGARNWASDLEHDRCLNAYGNLRS